jgi:DNA-binding response OmpR family regulator
MQGNILLVDDEPDQLELLEAILSESGFSTEKAGSGLEALKKVGQRLPDLIIVDGNMPQMNGFAFCESLRKNAAAAGVPIIMLTGLTGHLSRLNGLLHGASAYMTKPYKNSELVSKVSEFLKNRAGNTSEAQA